MTPISSFLRFFRTGIPGIILFSGMLLSPAGIDGFNHPEIKWKSVTTNHFQIHFSDKTEPAVYAAWKIAEEAYASLIQIYTYPGTKKINLALADFDDYSNGYAAWTQGAIMIWVPDAFFDLRGSNTWLRNVITHELAHIMSLEKKRGVQLLDWTLGASYSSSNASIAVSDHYPLTPFFPNWFVEGVAQAGSQRTGNDCWDNKRDMVLRCAFLDNKQLTLSEMGNFTHDYIGNEMVYNQGYSLVRFLQNELGETTFARILNDARGKKFNGGTIGKYFAKTLNRSFDELCKEWTTRALINAKAQVPSKPSVVTPVWEKGRMNAVPRISPDGRFWGWLTNDKDDYSRNDLVIAPYGQSKPVVRIAYAKTTWNFSPDGNSVYYVKSRTPDNQGSYLNEIFSYSLDKKSEKQLTRSGRVYDLVASPDGKSLACITYKNSVFSCEIFSLTSGQFTTVCSGKTGEPFVTVAYMPSNPAGLVVSRIVNGTSGLFTVDIQSGTIKPLAPTGAVQEAPSGGSDGRIYFSADYDGIFNIYSVLPDGADLKRHTTVIGGAFAPSVDSKGTILFSQYTSRGFGIVTGNDPGAAYTIPNTPACRFKPVPAPVGEVRIRAVPYKAQLLRPAWEIVTLFNYLDSDNAIIDRIRGTKPDKEWRTFYDIEAVLGMSRMDALDKKEMSMGISLIVWKEEQAVRKSRSQTYSGDVLQSAAELDYVNFCARPGFLQTDKPGHRPNLGTGVMQRAAYTRAVTHTTGLRGSTTTTSTSSQAMAYLYPFLGYESRLHRTTIGVQGQAMLILIIPAAILVQPYLEWHLARDLYAGVNPTVLLYPLSLFTEASEALTLQLPVWLAWQHVGYINEDFDYNQAGKSVVRGMGGIQTEPYIKIVKNEKDSLDTLYQRVTKPLAGIEAFHAFPLFKYGSLALSNTTQGTYSDRTLSGIINGTDSTHFRALLFSTTTVAASFPLVRNINRGRLYLDNLYGKVFYQLGLTATGEYFSNPSKNVFIDKEYKTPDAQVSHIIGAELKMGCIKAFTFPGMFAASAAWDLFNEKLFISITAGL